MKNQTFGIEIEMIMNRERAAKIAAGIIGGRFEYRGGVYATWACIAPDGRIWKFSRDSSIEAYDDEKCEFITPICKYDDIELIQNIIRALRKGGAQAHSSCGIHIHIGLGDHNAQTLRNLVNIINAREDLLTQALGILPERRTHWCKEVDSEFLRKLNTFKPKSLEKLAEIWYDTPYWRDRAEIHYDMSRYHLLNLHAVWQKGTIEFRAFNSTLHAGEIKAYIQFCLAVSYQALTAKSAQPKRIETDNPAYTFRTWLIRIGLNGDEFKTCRHHLIKNLPGNAAWRHGENTHRRTA